MQPSYQLHTSLIAELGLLRHKKVSRSRSIVVTVKSVEKAGKTARGMLSTVVSLDKLCLLPWQRKVLQERFYQLVFLCQSCRRCTIRRSTVQNLQLDERLSGIFLCHFECQQG